MGDNAKFKMLCEVLDECGYKYVADDEEGSVTAQFASRVDGVAVVITIVIDEDGECIDLFGGLSGLDVPKERYLQVACAICAANNSLANGEFLLNTELGIINYRQGLYFEGGVVNKQYFDYLLDDALSEFDYFDAKFVQVVRSEMSKEEIVALME